VAPITPDSAALHPGYLADDKIPQDQWADDPGTVNALGKWGSISSGMVLRKHGKDPEYVSTGAGQIRLAHGSFDKDIIVISDILRRMLGHVTLSANVENLDF
jgi:hypothetical protein